MEMRWGVGSVALCMSQKGNFLVGKVGHVVIDVTLFFAVVVWDIFFSFFPGAREVHVKAALHQPPLLISLRHHHHLS